MTHELQRFVRVKIEKLDQLLDAIGELVVTQTQVHQDPGLRIIENTRLVAFLATPHTGAVLGSVVKFFIPRLASTHVNLLSNDDGFLTNLNQSYRELATQRKIATVSYYEKYKTKNIVLVVSEESADPGVSGTRPVAVDADRGRWCATGAAAEGDGALQTAPSPSGGAAAHAEL